MQWHVIGWVLHCGVDWSGKQLLGGLRRPADVTANLPVLGDGERRGRGGGEGGREEEEEKDEGEGEEEEGVCEGISEEDQRWCQ